MNSYRILQTGLLAAALIIGVTAPAFNGQSLIALLLIGGVFLVEKCRADQIATVSAGTLTVGVQA